MRNAMASLPANAAPHDSAASPWPLSWRIAASVALVWHLVALLIGPISLPPSILGEAARTAAGGVYQAYLEAAFLDHAYKFFAPDPGPSHLIRYELVFDDGEPRSGVFPNLKEQWPRLLYHRHLMLSESLGGFSPDPDLPPDTPWEKLPLSPRQQAYARSYANHLLKAHGAREVALFLVQHRFPDPAEVEGGMQLDDPRLYRERHLYRLRVTTPKAPVELLPAAQASAR